MVNFIAPAGVENVARLTFYQGSGVNITPAMWLEVNGVKYAMAQYSSTFAVNEIPRATCMMATGELFDDQNNGLASGDILASTEVGVGYESARAKVYLNLDGSMWDPVTRRQWGGGDKVIFEGYVVGISYHRVEGKIQLAVELVSQLVDLTFGSVFSKNLHPGSALDFTNTAAMDLAGLACAGVGGAGGAGMPAWSIDNLFMNVNPIFGGRSSLDCAGNHAAGTMLGMLECCSKMNLFKIKCPQSVSGQGQNQAAEVVLTSLIAATGNWNNTLLQNPYKESIKSYLSTSLNQFRGTTFWDLLIQRWCPAFQFSFIPLPGTDGGRQGSSYGMLVPAWPTYRTPFKNLYLNDYVDFELRTQQHKPLSAVGVIAPFQSIVGAVPSNPKGGGGQGGARLCLGGLAGNPSNPKGQFLAVDAPGWLQNVLQSVPGATRLAGGVNVAADPNEGQGETETNFDKQKTATSQLLDGYANAFMTANYFRGRQGRFSSKLRFDISPGSIICLKATKNPLAGLNVNIGGVSIGAGGSSAAVKALPEDIYGHVSRVTYNINADAPMARTSFDLTAVRNTKENEGDYTVSSHPFVEGCAWNGSELVKGWGF